MLESILFAALESYFQKSEYRVLELELEFVNAMHLVPATAQLPTCVRTIKFELQSASESWCSDSSMIRQEFIQSASDTRK